MGGEPQFGVTYCPGPCDLRAIKSGYANFDGPDKPARIYERGEVVTMKYQRNNHGPGGFIRLTLVKPEDMMSAHAHAKNAFYYTCWGASPVLAKRNELSKDPLGFSMIGSDGQQHVYGKGYYEMNVTIPSVVPDGNYVLGWIWYGGTGSPVVSAKQQEPKPWGYFSDYHSCSFVRIEGGAPLQAKHTPVFNNDMTNFSTEGCMSANDRPGKCVWEPCYERGVYQKPFPFQNGKTPAALTPNHFGAETPVIPRYVKKKACSCIKKGVKCKKRHAAKTKGLCKARTGVLQQESRCKEECCDLCNMDKLKKYERKVCKSTSVELACAS